MGCDRDGSTAVRCDCVREIMREHYFEYTPSKALNTIVLC